jgi:hypothetical protein
LINRHNLYALLSLAGVLDVLLRHYITQEPTTNAKNTPWSSLNEILMIASRTQGIVNEGASQGKALASNTEKYWLGSFDSLCLNCGFLLVDEAGAD